MFILFGVMLLAVLSQNRTNTLKNEGKQDYLFYMMVVVWLCLFAGLRTSYNDTFTYIASYNDPADTPDLAGYFARLNTYSIGDNPAFHFLSGIIKCGFLRGSVHSHGENKRGKQNDHQRAGPRVFSF